MVGIYKIKSPTGKIYIGQSWNIDRRWKDYRSISSTLGQKLLNRSLAKYGVQNHLFEIVHELPCDCSQKTIDIYEMFYIESYRACGSQMLNLTTGGKGGKGSKRGRRIAKEVLVDMYIEKNMTKKEIAELLQEKERLIKKYLTEYNILKPSLLKLKKDEDIREMLSATRRFNDRVIKMRNLGMKYVDISTDLDIGYGVISNIISRNKINKHGVHIRRA